MPASHARGRRARCVGSQSQVPVPPTLLASGEALMAASVIASRRQPMVPIALVAGLGTRGCRPGHVGRQHLGHGVAARRVGCRPGRVGLPPPRRGVAVS